MGWFGNYVSSFIDPSKSYRNAAKEVKKGHQEGQGYLKPYNQAGTDQIGRLTGAENKLMDPAALQNEWASSYEMSPYAKQLQDQAMNSGMEGAGSMGLLGSSAALNTLQQGSSNIMQRDRQNFMNDLMQKYMTGIGVGQNIYNQGANTAGQLSQNANQYGQNMAGLKFGENNAMMNQLMNMIALYQASKGGGAGAGAAQGGGM